MPCPRTIECGSSDAYSEYEDHGHCFSCGKHFPFGVSQIEEEDNTGCTYEYLPLRGITKETMQRYNILTRINPDGRPYAVGFPYAGGALKGRKLDAKAFWTKGNISVAGLFGKELFPAGSAKSITVTEGELDAASVHQMLGGYPVVSVQSSSSAKRDCTTDRDYLNSFDRVYLCFDDDAAGQKATRDVATLFDFNKVYHVKLTGLKDANEFLTTDRVREFRNIWFNSRRFLPEGIISSYAEIRAALQEDTSRICVPYPWDTLQGMTGGMRTKEWTLWDGLEGVGKTEFLRQSSYQVVKTTDFPVANIFMEEGRGEHIKRLVTVELRSPVHTGEVSISLDEIMEAYQRLTKTDDRLHIYGHSGTDDPGVILDAIRFLVAGAGCKFVFFDHIGHAVSGLMAEDERKCLDMIVHRLTDMVEELDFHLSMVSHVNDEGQTRGSRLISKEAFTRINVTRNLTHESEFMRNIAELMLSKNRPRQKTGPAGKYLFNPETGLLLELKKEELPK